MAGLRWLTILLGLTISATSQAQNVNKKIGDIDLFCPPGWVFLDTSCYFMFSQMVEWMEAESICKKHLSMPLEIEDEVENMELAKMAGASSWDSFWVGEKIEDKCNGYWDNFEPPATVKSGDCAIVQTNATWRVVPCQSRHPFVCKKPACIQGTFDCGNGNCINQKSVCDGINDCGHNLDELMCTSQCTFRRTETAGAFNFFTLTDPNDSDCYWTFVTPPGTQISANLTAVQLEDKVDFLEVWVGGQVLPHAMLIERVTGNINLKTVNSYNNMMMLRLLLNSVGRSFQFTFTWTTFITELSPDVRTVLAGPAWNALESPFYPQTPPSGFRREWLVSTSDESIVTLEIEKINLSPDWMLIIYNGEGYDDQLLMASNASDIAYPAIYFSTNSKMRIIIKGIDTSGGGEGVKMRYKNGCSVDIQTGYGVVESPGYSKNGYPTSVTCSWVLRAPTTANRDMKLKFHDLKLDTGDFIQVFDGADATATALSPTTPNNGYTGDLSANLPTLTGGNIFFIKFISSLIQNEGKFKFEFSVDCPYIPDSPNMLKSSNNTFYETTVSISCETGYSFQQQEYYLKSSITFTCNKGGKWDKTRYPTCQIIYCGSPKAIDFGVVENSTNAVTYNNRARYKCYEGFNMVNPAGAEVVCQTNGEWSTPPTCRSAVCSTAPNVFNAEKKIITDTTETSYGAIVEYTCNTGYELLGTSRRRCQTNTQWSHSAPTCVKKKCPLPVIKNGNLNVVNAVDYLDSITLTCMTGYVASTNNITTASLQCKADRTFDKVECVDENECMRRTPPCLLTQDCMNTIGSHTCTCKKGYTKLPTGQCQEVDECTSGTSDCRQDCENTPVGSYTCSCKAGFKLFENGTNGVTIVPGETGLRMDDVYRVNHSCVRNTCPRPPALDNGMILSQRTIFHFEDEIMYSCNLGFTLSPNSKRVCQANGVWSGSNPVCIAIKCAAQSRVGTAVQQAQVKGIYPETQVGFREKVIIECNRPDGTSFNKTRFCAFDRTTQSYTLQGDAPECPVVDCGPVEDIPGLSKPNLGSTVFGQTFPFFCQSGAIRSGQSTEGTTTVKCLASGRWGYGNLTCTAAKCPDPKTHAGTRQRLTSYEQGQIVSYECIRSGFTVTPKANITCVFSGSSASWNGVAPTCIDSTSPQFVGCDGVQTVSIDKMQVPGFQVPAVSDNAGFVATLSVTPLGFRPSDPVWRNTQVIYTATDGSNNVKQCQYQININDRSPGSLTCPPNIEYQATTTPTTYNITDRLTYSGGQLTTFPQITASLNNVGTVQDYRVTLRTDLGTERTCAFRVKIVAGGCYQQLLPSLPNTEMDVQTSGNGLQVTVSCPLGWAFSSGRTSMIYTCSGQYVWNPNLPMETCIQYTATDYSFDVSLTLTTTDPVFGNDICRTDFSNIYNNALSSGQLNSLCRRGIENTTFYTFTASDAKILDPVGFNSHKVSLKLKVNNNDGQATALNDCRNKLNSEMATAFKLDTPSCKFNVDTSSQAIASGQAGESCPKGSTLTSVQSNNQCIPCRPGTYTSGDGSCVECPDGQYQDAAGQAVCKSCGSDMASLSPRRSSTQCVKKCTAGFYSASGKPDCLPCPENSYWTNYTTCTACPDQGSTLYVQGATSNSQCSAPCPAGQYSQTGYVPCTVCPLHYYQSRTAQTQCVECATNMVTDQLGSQSLNDCKAGVTDVCNTTCNTEGTASCTYINHRLTCTCKQGYTGSQCGSQINYCLSNPCFNGGQCMPTLGSYTCDCPGDSVCNMTEVSSRYNDILSFIQSIAQTTEEACKQQCISNQDCVAAAFSTISLCTLYNAAQYATKTANSASTTKYFEKSCTKQLYYSGTNCEQDNLDNCANNNCHESSVCRDLVNNRQCVCPAGAEVINSLCEPKSALCSPNPCKNNGICSMWDAVRYQCTCLPGYTGKDCEVQINECDMNPDGCLYGGRCIDAVNSYSCSCDLGYSGLHCETERNYCAAGTCSNGLCVNNYVNLTSDCICETPFEKNVNGFCSRMNFCASSPCRNSTYTQRCDSLADGYRCVCRPGYEGSLCQHNIDDCADNPCEHGTCIDGVSSYSCECDPGWTGGTCNVDEIDCVGQCDSTKTLRCEERNQDYECVCRPGFKGKNCTEEINECDSLPCQHGGACTDAQAGYTCNCKPGWEGDNCEKMQDTCTSGGITCLNEGVCFSVFTTAFCSCKKGTQGLQCEDTKDVCTLLPPCTSQGNCVQKGGSGTCTCTEFYSGVSCQLIKDHCSDGVCKNGGTCSLTQPMGYKCDCPSGFSGPTCETKNAVCPGNCPPTTLCYAEGEKAYCLCPANQVLSGTTCREASMNFDIFLEAGMYASDKAVTSVSPFYLSGDMTVMLWIGYFSSNRSVIISSIDGSKTYFELFSTKVRFSANGESQEAEMSPTSLETIKGQWDHVAVTWSATGKYAVFINGLLNTQGTLSFNLTNCPNLKVVKFDPQFSGYVSRVTVWRKVLSNMEISASVGNVNYNPSGDLALGWTLYELTSSSRLFVQSRAGNSVKLCSSGRPQMSTCPGLPNKMKPVIASCQENDVVFKTDDRTIEVIKVFTRPTAPGNLAVVSTLKDDLVMKGRYDVVYAANDTDGNYGICRFKVYIQGTSPCTASGFSRSVACGSNAITGFCPSGQQPSVPIPNILQCGKLGSYNLRRPLEPFIPPVCGETSDQFFSVRLYLTYTVTVRCNSFTIEAIKPLLNTAFINVISKRWTNLCTPSCANMKLEARCDEFKVHLTTIFINLQAKLTKNDNSVSLRPDEILLITAKEGNDLTFPGVAVLQKDIVTVRLLPSCSQAVGINKCVRCGPGSYFQSSTGTCILCPVGTYTSSSSQTSCTSCGDKTTLRPGSKSPTDCVVKCKAGNELKGSSCQPCRRDYYQELEGQSFCYPCPLNERTVGSGTANASLCSEDCPSGTQLQGDKSCKDCAQGFYRTRTIHDNCQQCSGGNTTEGPKTESSSGCVLPPCSKGQFINQDRVCLDCPRGEYQPDKWKRECKKCPMNYTTENEREFNESMCRFVCPKGQEEYPAGSKMCRMCPKGQYRDDSLAQRFLSCQNCTMGFTTPSEGASNTTDCTIRICYAGTYRNVSDNKCYQCPVGEYQDEDLQTECKKCKSSYTTVGKGSTNETKDCKFFCPDGQQILSAANESCTICPRGTYRSNTDALRFESCQNCTTDTTTDAEGAKVAADCKLKVCTAGQELTSNLLGCNDCLVDYYQENSLPSSKTKCVKCEAGRGTKQSKTTKKSDCLPFCPAGQQVGDNGACEACPKGTWNDGSQQRRFLKCEKCGDPLFTTQSTGATTASDCSLRNCEAGSKIVSGNNCEDCGYGKYQPQRAQTTCLDCSAIGPDLNTSTTTASSADQCTVSCPPGKQGQQGSCSTCPADTFKDTQGYDICQPCTGSVTSDTNRVSCTLTFCDKGVGYKSDTQTCVNCLQGFYKETRGNTICMECPKNFTTAGPSSKSAADCSELNCEPGFFAHNTAICTPCPVGYYKSTMGKENCTKCADDRTTVGMASTSDTQCNLAVCPAGQYRTNTNACEQCPVEQYQPNPGSTGCLSCTPGYTTLTTGKTMATDCLIVCPAGKYRTARDACTDCEIGRYQPNTGADTCLNCTAGYTTQNKASKAESDCYRVCPVGQFRPTSDRTACNKCPRGQYQPASGQTSCMSCNPNFSTLQDESTDANQCMPLCSSGKYLNVTIRSCLVCALGTYQPLSGTLVQECTRCPDGKTTANTGSTVSANCNLDDCNAGYYRSEGQGCQACGQGYYQPEKSQTSCIKCEAGKTTQLNVLNATSATKCILDCPDGQEYNVVNKQCINCPIGRIRDKTRSDQCYLCPLGQSTTRVGALTCIEAPAPPTAVLVRIRVVIRISFLVVVCENRILIEHTIRTSVFSLVRAKSVRFPSLCLRNCGNVRITFTRRCTVIVGRKKRAPETVEAELTVTDLPERIDNADNTLSMSGESLLVDAVANNDAVKPSLDQAGITFSSLTAPTVTETCLSGAFKNAQGVCESCPAGTRHNTTSDMCVDCGMNQYQDQTGQTTCKPCPGTLQTQRTRSNSSNNCVSICVTDKTYCKNGGICQDVDANTVKCVCKEPYTGSTCTIRESVESDLQWIIIGVCAGIFVVLIVILVIGCCCCRKDSDETKNKDLNSIVAPSTSYPDYMQSPFMTRDYLAPQGYVQYRNPEFNEAYDFYKSGRRYSDH